MSPYPAVRRPKVLREMAFRAARRRRGVARGRRDGAAAGGCDSMQLGRPSRHDGGVSAQVLGAAGGIGQPLSLLLKADPLVSGLSLYDVVNTPGVAADLSHCNTPATVTGVTGVGNAEEALKGADVVVIPAGSWFGVLFFYSRGAGAATAAYVTRHAVAATTKRRRRPAQAGHDARRPLQHERVHRRVPRRGVREGLPQRVLPHHLQPGRRRGAEMNLTRSRRWRLRETTSTRRDAVATPSTRRRRSRDKTQVNSTVPIFAETLKKHGVYDKNKLIGVTTLDVVRANTFVAENQGKDVRDVKVDVIGGHAGTTIIPLLSQVPSTSFSDADVEALTQRIMFGGDEVVKAKDGAGSATLSMAYAGAHFTSQLLKALDGQTGFTECAFVESSVTDAPYFSTPVSLGPGGVSEVHGYGTLSAYEQDVLDKAVPDLIAQAEKGIAFAGK